MAITLSSFFRRVPRWVWLVVIPIGVIVLALGILAALPVAADPPLAEEDWGAGAVNILPATSGLLREWPDTGEDFDPELARLGYQLFFDPILSGDNTRSCASCHHPDWAFSEPRPRAIGPDGTETIRHTPTLWNVAYASTLFWDGRAESLEAQALESLGSAQEMNQSIAALTRELEAIDAYDQQFNAIFADGITQDSIAAALAAFERTLISDSAPFDRYAAGDFEAITAQQRRGLATFRSAGTRCFECHIAPTFTDNGFAVIGVPDSGLGDIGRGTVQSGLEYAFRTPTLRNALASRVLSKPTIPPCGRSYCEPEVGCSAIVTVKRAVASPPEPSDTVTANGTFPGAAGPDSHRTQPVARSIRIPAGA